MKASGLPRASTRACILVLNPPLLRPIASFCPLFLSAGAVLVSAHNRGIDHRVFVVRVGCQSRKQLLPNTALRPPAKSRVNVLPWTKSFRQITPRYPRPVTVEHRFNEQPIVRGRYPDMAVASR